MEGGVADDSGGRILASSDIFERHYRYSPRRRCPPAFTRAAMSRPLANGSPVPTAAIIAVEMIGPTPERIKCTAEILERADVRDP